MCPHLTPIYTVDITDANVDDEGNKSSGNSITETVVIKGETEIAAGCEITDLKDPKLFFTGKGHAFISVESCTYEIILQGGDGQYNGICYHVMTNSFNVFDSKT